VLPFPIRNPSAVPTEAFVVVLAIMVA